jgi:hypothetical protein
MKLSVAGLSDTPGADLFSRGLTDRVVKIIGSTCVEFGGASKGGLQLGRGVGNLVTLTITTTLECVV